MSTIQNQVSAPLLSTMNTSKNSAATGVDDAQNRFMTLLVTQMKNQDPLNPLDNAQVTSQLAQLSTVTGIDKLNTSLASLISNVQSSQSLQATSMIGHNVLVDGSKVQLSGGVAPFGISLPSSANSVTVSVLDASGNTVREVALGALPAGTSYLQWDGKTDAGTDAAAGSYKIAVKALAAGQTLTATTLSLGQVSSVSNDATGVTLNLSNDLGRYGLADIREIL